MYKKVFFFFVFWSLKIDAFSDPIILYQVKGDLNDIEDSYTPDDILASYLSRKLFLNEKKFSLIAVKHSLIQTHHIYQQIVEGIPLRYAQIIISTEEKTGKLSRIFDHSIDQKPILPAEEKITEEQAKELAWQFLKVSGHLLDAPTVKERVYFDKEGFSHVYDVYFSVSDPFGYWLISVDVYSGKINRVVDLRRARKPFALPHFNKRKQTTVSRKKEENIFFSQQKNYFANYETINGETILFDPDPRTFIGSDALDNNSSTDLFKPAFEKKVLKDISFDGKEYFLRGPWVVLNDFELPYIPAQTSTDSFWQHERGNNSLNDVMTYYHIDKNQRYIQSLGFVAEKGIQYKPIQVDANGLSGADNSHYIPESNKIAFGHGCVADNEDADVILHEYAHALQFSINPEWWGKDTGAMGEGFGDYWAQSYSYTTKNGSTYLPEKVFQWDGSSNCWDGRRLNVKDVLYDPIRYYDAHTFLENDIISDELWSTPLYQSFLEALANGISKEQVDQTLLESHFGLGADISMRQMAENIIVVSKMLFPGSMLTDIFRKHFLLFNIIETPKATLLIKEKLIADADKNNIFSPGETLDIDIILKNTGIVDARNIKVFLRSPDNLVEIINGSENMQLISAHKEQRIENPFRVSIKREVSCGTEVKLDLYIYFSDEQERSIILPIKFIVGRAIFVEKKKNIYPPIDIPDNDPQGITDVFDIYESGTILNAEVGIDITHSFIGDLSLEIKSPRGEKVMLHERQGFNLDNLIGTYPTTLASAQSMDILQGLLVDGRWTLHVRDHSRKDVGFLNTWSVKFLVGYTCH